jgi:hypothetical protein
LRQLQLLFWQAQRFQQTLRLSQQQRQLSAMTAQQHQSVRPQLAVALMDQI